MAEKLSLNQSRIRSAWLFITPMIVVMVLVAGWPLLRTLWFSFTDADLKELGAAKFVGFSNYVGEYGLLADPEWWNAVLNTIRFSVISVTLETVLGLIVALVLNAKFPGRALVRAAVLIPWAIPTIVSAKMWAWMMHDQFGVLNYVLMGLHIINQPLAWTADPALAMNAVIMVDVWKTTPFMALMILAALQMLPTDCYEAARVDGIHPVRVFFKVTLPLIRPALMVAVIFRALDALRVFDLIYVLTSNSKDTMSMSVYSRQQLVDFQQVGFGSAASTVLFLIVALCTAAYITIGRVKFDGDAR
ncbi:carbohydrate ABC transporter membrane protein 1 (CUT1 family) [Plasticicumulans lactativorans]|uniref:Carbohydrate ABC transporter membrane protein 1 (CUT1 family) n=1 Tax=Plasticicumulans lactativorans TaxID=1133106 RepID=A0A4R2KT58_9GAMM|nr:sugar ABC transporter permease [Plasticicumulans lactativorans]TCO75992.1 carbohydrate ABC transporter membrane protein 1 (CUT1 family) [Plasticicumulans lactativorans]